MGRMTSVIAVTAFSALCPGLASAHALLETTKATQNSVYKGVIEIDHGCEGSATQAIHVTIPEGFIAAKPMPKAGWTLTIDSGPYAKPYPFRGSMLAQGAKTLTWQGNLPAEDYDEFVFEGFVSESIPAGGTLLFPVVQDCVKGSYHWVETPKDSDLSAMLAHPAPGVVVASGASTASAVSIIDHLRVSEPWVRASSGDAGVTQAYFTVENRGTLQDRLLSVTSDAVASITIVDARATAETDGEAPVTNGLTIAPGERLELRPGAYHLALNGLKKPLSTGQTVQATVTFEKAGPLTLSFSVEDSHALSTGAVMPIEDAPDRM